MRKNQNKKPQTGSQRKKQIVFSMSEAPKIKWLRKVENKSLGKGMPGKYQQKIRNPDLSIKHTEFKANSIQQKKAPLKLQENTIHSKQL